MGPTWKIGQVARAAGISVDAVRFYERRGLLPRPRRRASGYRTYAPSIVDRLQLIKQLQALGLSLDEVAGMLREVDAGRTDCNDACQPMDAALMRLDERLAELQQLRDRLSTAMQACRSGCCGVGDRLQRAAVGGDDPQA